MPTITQLAEQMLTQLETGKRENGDEYLRLKDGRPEWTQDIVRDGHGGMCWGEWQVVRWLIA